MQMLSSCFDKITAYILQCCGVVVAGFIAKYSFICYHNPLLLLLSFEIFILLLQHDFTELSCTKTSFLSFLFFASIYTSNCYHAYYFAQYLINSKIIILLCIVMAFSFFSTFYFLACFIAKKITHDKISFLILFSTLITVSEIVINSYICTFSPFTLAQGLLNLYYCSQIISFCGQYGFTFLFLIFLSCINTRKYYKIGIGIAIILTTFGMVKTYYNTNDNAKNAKNINVNLIQTNINKDYNDYNFEELCRYISPTTKKINLNNDDVNFIFTPEGCYLSDNIDNVKTIANMFKHKNVYFGFWSLQRIKNKHYSTYHIFNDNTIVKTCYKKHPFFLFEYIPQWLVYFFNVVDNLFSYNISEEYSSQLSPYYGENIVAVNENLKFNVDICLDSIVKNNYIISKCDFMVCVASLRFCQGEDVVEQYINNCRVRAIEYGVPMVLICNCGKSCIISPHGEIIGFTDTNTKQVLSYKLTFSSHGMTFFQKYRYLLLWIIIVFILLFFVITYFYRKKKYNYTV